MVIVDKILVHGTLQEDLELPRAFARGVKAADERIACGVAAVPGCSLLGSLHVPRSS
jgi:hypothetical protein